MKIKLPPLSVHHNDVEVSANVHIYVSLWQMLVTGRIRNAGSQQEINLGSPVQQVSALPTEVGDEMMGQTGI